MTYQGLNLITWNRYFEKCKYAVDILSKFSKNPKPNKFKFASCINFNNLFSDDWDLFVMLFRDTAAIRNSIKKKFNKLIPLYAVFDTDYLIVSRLVGMQIYELSAACTFRDIGDLYLKEMGAVLASKNITFPRLYKGVKFPILQEISKKGTQFIEPNNHGWLSTNTRLCLENTIKIVKSDNLVVVELGSWLGQSACVILQTMKSGQLYCFDHFQNVAATDYSFKEPHPLDKFWLTVPRYETFCRNVAPFLKSSVRAYTVKYDVVKSVHIMRMYFIKPDIVFIDAIKNTHILMTYLTDLFKFSSLCIVVGDDYVFDSVKEAVAQFTKIHKNYYLTTTADCYILGAAAAFNHFGIASEAALRSNFSKYISSEIKHDPIAGAVEALYQHDHLKCTALLKAHKIDINSKLQLFNDNTFYTLVVIQVVIQKSKSAMEVQKYILKNIDSAPKKVQNALFLTWQDYIDRLIRF